MSLIRKPDFVDHSRVVLEPLRHFDPLTPILFRQLMMNSQLVRPEVPLSSFVTTLFSVHRALANGDVRNAWNSAAQTVLRPF